MWDEWRHFIRVYCPSKDMSPNVFFADAVKVLLPTCSCGSFWCRRGEQKARWRRLPGSCCPVGWLPDTWLLPADHRTLSSPPAPPSVCCSPSDRTACRRQGREEVWANHWRPLGLCLQEEPHLIMPSSAALQKVLGHMGAVAMRLTLLVWSENMWMVSFTVTSCTWTFVSAAPVIKILSPVWGRNWVDETWNMRRLEVHTNQTKTYFAVILFEILLTFTENIFAAWPVCIVVSFLWRNGSQTMTCWSSEPEASKLHRKITFRKLRKHTWVSRGLHTFKGGKYITAKKNRIEYHFGII